MAATHQEQTRPHGGRIPFFDTLRGFTVISMVCFHAAYDAAYIYGYGLDWFLNPVIQNVWRASISWVFLALAGWMCAFSSNNARRGARYAAAALLVWVATTIAAVDTPISFGILFCMAASTLLYAFAAPALTRIPPTAGLLICLALFAATYTVPDTRVTFEGLAWLGFPGPTFTSGDYYPMIPFTFMYLAGTYATTLFAKTHPRGYPTWMQRIDVKPLAFIGRHSLAVYLVHQVLLVVVFEALALIT